DRIAGQDVEAAQRGAEDARVPQQRRGGVDVRRGAHLVRDAPERHALAAQLSAAADEVVHGEPASGVEGEGEVEGEGGVEVEGEGEVEGAVEGDPPSGASCTGGCGGPFAPQYAVASTAAATAARSIRRGWRG